MQFQALLSGVPGVVDCGVAMATPANKAQFEQAGILTDEMRKADSNDLCIVVRVDGEDAVSRVLEKIERHFQPNSDSGDYLDEVVAGAKSISTAVRRVPHANLAVISVPGDYAAFEAMNALSSGLHVFLFSDNVPVEDEIELKSLADEKDLLVMGPDCGTSIISGVGLGFSNRVRRGKIGIVAAAGSGMQEASCLIHRMGEGISQAIGTGGRDLSGRVGGRTFLRALDALAADEQTELLVLISKHCDEEVAQKILERVEGTEKPVVFYFSGVSPLSHACSGKLYEARHLEHLAATSVALLRGEGQPEALDSKAILNEMGARLSAKAAGCGERQKYLRALLCGGSFVDQACTIIPSLLEGVYAYPAAGQAHSLEDPLVSRGHTILDLGEDYFTRGRAHPMIDPSIRNERILREAADPEVKVILLDVVLGYGAHPDPAGNLAKVMAEALSLARARGGELCVVVSLCGTEEDVQGYDTQRDMLTAAGALVTESSTRAALIAGLLAAR